MSIASEITRLQNAKADIKSAIESKGVTVPTGASIDVYDEYVSMITGGDAGWQPHPDWIDISTVGNNEINLLVKDTGLGIAFAVNTSSGTYSIDWGDGVVEHSRAGSTTYSHSYTAGGGQSVDGGAYTVYKIRIYNATGNITRFQIKPFPGYNRMSYVPLLWAVFGTDNLTTFEQTFYQVSLVNCSILEAVKMPNLTNCTTLYYAFRDCASLIEVQLPSSWGGVTNLNNAFHNCVSLEKIELPTSWGNVTSLQQTFYGCTGLTEINLPTSWGSITDLSYTLWGCSSLKSIILPTTWDSVSNIQYFLSGAGVKGVTLPNSWGSITNTSYCFSGCKSLRETILPTSWGSVTTVTGMFNNCLSLGSAVLPTSWGSVTGVGYMFAGCTSITRIVLATSVGNVSVVTQMFYLCTSLKTVVNLEYLGRAATGTDFTDLLRDAEAIEGTLTIGTRLTKIGIYGASGYSLKCTGIRLTNGANTWTGSSPQVNVSYCNLDAAALNTLFGDLETVSGKTINITGNPGAATCTKSIATSKGWTVTG